MLSYSFVIQYFWREMSHMSQINNWDSWMLLYGDINAFLSVVKVYVYKELMPYVESLVSADIKPLCRTEHMWSPTGERFKKSVKIYAIFIGRWWKGGNECSGKDKRSHSETPSAVLGSCITKSFTLSVWLWTQQRH